MHLIASIIILFKLSFVITTKPTWTYDILEIENVNLTPDILDCQFRKTRVSRGVYALGGFVDINQDLTDDLLIRGDIFYSQTGSGRYTKTPFQAVENKASYFFNTFYKNYCMDSFAKCSDNAPYFVDKIQMPISKRKILFNDCVISQDNLPPYLTPGYYKIVYTYSNQANGTMSVLWFVQPNN